MSNQQEPQQHEQEEGRIYHRVIEQVDAREAVELIDVLNRLERLKWSLELWVRIN